MAGAPHRTRQQGRPRHTLTLTGPGREELRRRLREADEVDISDENRWFTVLAFLHHLSSPAEQADVLRQPARVPGGAEQLLLRGGTAAGRRVVRRPVPARAAEDRPRDQRGGAGLAGGDAGGARRVLNRGTREGRRRPAGGEGDSGPSDGAHEQAVTRRTPPAKGRAPGRSGPATPAAPPTGRAPAPAAPSPAAPGCAARRSAPSPPAW